jgi:hypothetical protein
MQSFKGKNDPRIRCDGLFEQTICSSAERGQRINGPSPGWDSFSETKFLLRARASEHSPAPGRSTREGGHRPGLPVWLMGLNRSRPNQPQRPTMTQRRASAGTFSPKRNCRMRSNGQRCPEIASNGPKSPDREKAPRWLSYNVPN